MPATRKAVCYLTALLCVILAAGCGERREETAAPGSFAMAAAVVPAGSPTAPAASPAVTSEEAAESSAAPPPAALPSEAANTAAALVKGSAKPVAASAAPAQTTADVKPSLAPAASPTAAPSVSPSPSPAEKPAAPVGSASNEIKWSEFFDDELQNHPSEKFWNMNGRTVTIKGYMGEVLSFEKHWFLIIPSPGAECPFDNGDESYWNTIMIAFTSSGERLRFTPGPLEITGRLDVGIKIDESGYKTMFRLYDAKFEKLKE